MARGGGCVAPSAARAEYARQLGAASHVRAGGSARQRPRRHRAHDGSATRILSGSRDELARGLKSARQQGKACTVQLGSRTLQRVEGAADESCHNNHAL